MPRSLSLFASLVLLGAVHAAVGVVRGSSYRPNALSAASWPCAYYSSPSGSDSNNGSASMPFRTIARGQAALAAVPRPLSGPTVLCLRGGTYYESVVLNPADSGSAVDAPAAIAAFPGEIVIVSAGMPVTFEPLPASDAARDYVPPAVAASLVYLSLPAVGLSRADYGDIIPQGGFSGCTGAPGIEIVFNGAAQTLARWPNAVAGAFGGPYATTALTWASAQDHFTAAADAPYFNWKDQSDIWFHGSCASCWYIMIVCTPHAHHTHTHTHTHKCCYFSYTTYAPDFFPCRLLVVGCTCEKRRNAAACRSMTIGVAPSPQRSRLYTSLARSLPSAVE